jgi:hypothetical protein
VALNWILVLGALKFLRRSRYGFYANGFPSLSLLKFVLLDSFYSEKVKKKW